MTRFKRDLRGHLFLDLIPGTEVRRTSLGHVGLFATQVFGAGALLAQLDGQWVAPDDFMRRSYAESAEWDLVGGLVLVRAIPTSLHFARRGEDANIRVALRAAGQMPIVVVAGHPINEGDEIIQPLREAHP